MIEQFSLYFVQSYNYIQIPVAMTFENSRAFAEKADQQDSLRSFRDRFLFPEHNGKKCLYFTGNSLGLQPVTAREALLQELEDWARLGVEGHFHAKNPWFAYHELLTDSLARVVGARSSEVVAMNGLTTNLHLLMVSFFRPSGKRTKILCEAKAFPSDRYALDSQLIHHGLNPKEHLIALDPREGESCLRNEDIISAIEDAGETLALLMIGGVNYYTGQFFDIPAITRAAHRVGAFAGWDLAHAAGNLPLQLHAWDVDFASWCSYKYLNSGPGSVAGIFIHEKHASNTDLPRFAGWWGHDKTERFEMRPEFKAIASAEGWQLSNAPVFSMAVHKVALDIFDEAGMNALRRKSIELTGYLEHVLQDIGRSHANASFEVITPEKSADRGCQLSVLVHGHGRELFEHLMAEGVVVDWREPNVIRMAPVPLYNSFEDIFRFGEALSEALQKKEVKA